MFGAKIIIKSKLGTSEMCHRTSWSGWNGRSQVLARVSHTHTNVLLKVKSIYQRQETELNTTNKTVLHCNIILFSLKSTCSITPVMHVKTGMSNSMKEGTKIWNSQNGLKFRQILIWTLFSINSIHFKILPITTMSTNHDNMNKLLKICKSFK